MNNVLKPIDAPFPPHIAAELKNYPSRDGYQLNLFRTFANSLRFLTNGVPNLLDTDSPIPLRDREIVILRVTALRACEYEWGVHVAIFQKAAGLSDEEVAATCAEAPDPALWSDRDLTLVQVVDQLCETGRLDDHTLAAFRAQWTVEQQLEILALCGAYSTVSFVANVSELPKEPFAARFPAT